MSTFDVTIILRGDVVRSRDMTVKDFQAAVLQALDNIELHPVTLTFSQGGEFCGVLVFKVEADSEYQAHESAESIAESLERHAPVTIRIAEL